MSPASSPPVGVPSFPKRPLSEAVYQSSAIMSRIELSMTERQQARLNTYARLFCHRRDVYAQQTDKGGYFLKQEPVTETVVESHLQGKITAGWYALAEDNTIRWVCLDADRDDGLAVLQEAWKQFQSREISASLLLESSRRGGHLWLFFEPIPARLARQLVINVLPQFEGGVEVFPKRDELSAGVRVGNLVRGPLGIHRMTGQRYPFLDPLSRQPLARTVGAALDQLREIRPMTPTQVAEILANLLVEAKKPPPPAPIQVNTRPAAAPARTEGQLPLRNSPIEQIKEAIGDPYEFISRFVELDESGRGHCPFHPPDEHPSFAVDRKRGFFTDFHELNPRTGRYAGGDVIEFYRRLKGFSYKEAVQQLQELLGLKT